MISLTKYILPIKEVPVTHKIPIMDDFRAIQ